MNIIIKKVNQVSKIYLMTTLVLLLVYVSMTASGEKINALPNNAIDQISILIVILKTGFDILGFKILKKESNENIYTILISVILIGVLSSVNMYNVYEYCNNQYSLYNLIILILSIIFIKLLFIFILKAIDYIKCKIDFKLYVRAVRNHSNKSES